MATDLTIGFAGSGNMAAAIARGFARAEACTHPMLFTDAGSGRAGTLADELSGETRPDLAALAADADIIVLAVKPAGLEAAADALGPQATTIVSVLGATSLDQLRSAFPEAGIVRTMPNVAVEVGEGVVVYAEPDGLSDELSTAVVGLLGCLGLAVELPERLIDTATAIMGCSPAYFALMTEALADAGVKEGLDAATANRLVVATMAGTAALLEDHDTLSVRRSVTSPGGSTAAGLAALEDGAARAAFAAAVAASLEKMR